MSFQFPASQPSATHLTAARIATFGAPQSDQIDIEVVAETGSTNADLLARIGTVGADSMPPALTRPTLLVAETQTAGRGRAGRAWLSAPSAALTFSLAWPFEGPLQGLVGLPLAVGVAIAETLAGFGVDVQLKWPNDILRFGSKLAGVLIETASSAQGKVWAVIGIGINIAIPDEIRQQIGRDIANLQALAAQDRDLLLGVLLSSLTHNMQQFERDGLAVFVERWNRLHAYAGQTVVILDHGKVLHEGTALGIDRIGRLLLQTDKDSTPIAIMAGDISLRVKDPE
ncbi:biotin--[acetyl-CoA-carboxylase] ligase [Paraherbaspirillum soli]|uniref:biotin--[biotin carboxyl-carrier protein] ligase n=1 Tax=Paraherbaspirillum soli TaxID=631222 RepID=A0ABW0M885_9BURK